MAGEWMPVRLAIHRDPAVIQMCETLGLDHHAVVGRLVYFWAWANEQLALRCHGMSQSVTRLGWVDKFVEFDGFAEAMRCVGWLEVDDDGRFTLPGFDRYNSQGAKRRMDASKRQAEYRARTRDKLKSSALTSVTDSCDTMHKSPLPRGREEKRDIQKQTAEPPKPAVGEGSTRPPRKRKSPAKEKAEKKPRVYAPNPMFDVIAEVCRVSQPTTREMGALIGKVSASLNEAKYSLDEVRDFARRFWVLCPWAAKDRQLPTPGVIAKSIHLVRAKPTAKPDAPSPFAVPTNKDVIDAFRPHVRPLAAELGTGREGVAGGVDPLAGRDP